MFNRTREIIRSYPKTSATAAVLLLWNVVASPDPGEGNIQFRPHSTITSIEKLWAAKKLGIPTAPVPVNPYNIGMELLGKEKSADLATITKARNNLLAVDAKNHPIACPWPDQKQFRSTFTYSAATDDVHKEWCLDMVHSVIRNDSKGVPTLIFPVVADPNFSAKAKISPYISFKKNDASGCEHNGKSYVKNLRDFSEYIIMQTGNGIVPVDHPVQTAFVADIGSLSNPMLRTTCDTWPRPAN